MAIYEYTAKDHTGREFSGTYDQVDSAAVLRNELAKMGYTLVKARRGKRPGRKQKIKKSEVVAFAYKFAGMYSAGLPILNCLETLEEQAENRAFRSVVADVKQSVEVGSSLKNAFEKHRSLFSDFFLGMIGAGEAGGKLSQALASSAEYLEKQLDLKWKVRSAFAYPAVVGAVCFAVVVALVVFVVPVFAKIYQQLHAALPVPTQVLVSLSALIRNRWWFILIIAVAALLALARIRNSASMRKRWDAFKLNMPIVGKLNRMVMVSHFTRTFAMLTSVGVSIIDALDVASQVAANHKLTEITRQLQDTIRAGNAIGPSLKNYDVFPAMITELAISGEQTGTLPEMLNKGADLLDKDIDRLAHALLVKLEPALTVIMGVIVGLMLMAVYLPMFDYMRHLK